MKIFEALKESYKVCLAGFAGGIMGAWFTALADNRTPSGYIAVLIGFIALVVIYAFMILLLNGKNKRKEA